MDGFLNMDPVGALNEASRVDGYEIETRTCSQCKYFSKTKGTLPICKKRSMMVVDDLHVCYNIKVGTCFEV